MKGEPDWMLDFRLKSLPALRASARCPTGAATCRRSTSTTSTTTSSPPTSRSTSGTSCPTPIKNTYEKLGIPEAERKYLAGVTAQYESEVVFHRNREDLEAPGRHLLRHGHRAPGVPRARASRTSARSSRRTTTSSPSLNSAVWSGGSFIYVPPGVEVEMPLQAYFRINAENMGQFERTLIIADEGSQGALHRGLLGPGVHHRLAALGRRRDRRQAVGPGHLHDHPELVEQRLQPGHQAGPGRGRGPHGVDRRQHRQPPHHEVPGRLHGRARRPRARCCRSPTPAPASTRTPAPRWSTPRPRPRRRSCRSRSPRTAAAPRYRGLVRVEDDAYGCKSHVQCDALILDEDSISDTYPYMEVGAQRRRHRPRGHRVQGRRRAALLPDEPRPLRGAGHGHGRQRLHRAGHPHAARWSTRSSGSRLIELQMEGSVG